MNQHHLRAQQLINAKRYELALPELGAALAQEPDKWAIHANQALCLANLDDYGAALIAAKRAVALAPDEAHPLYVLACIHNDRSDLLAA